MTDSEIFIGTLWCAYNRLASKRAYLDELNVFPVPDSDTGTNLCRTFKAGAEAVKRSAGEDVPALLEKASKAMLRNARGNSGVILSALFKGFSDYINEVGSFSVSNLSAAFDRALKNACGVIGRPIFKGTVLSVVIACRDALLKNRFESEKEAFSFLVPVAENALKRTGEELPEAKKAGVVDSGAAGLFFIIEAVSFFLSERTDGKEVFLNREEAEETVSFKKFSSPEKVKYIYCTEFLVFRKNREPASELEKKLLPLGDCVIVASDDEIIKVHLHTNDPGKAMSLASDYGALTDIKIDNMQLQTKEAAKL